MGDYHVDHGNSARARYDINSDVTRQRTIAAMIRHHRQHNPDCPDLLDCVLAVTVKYLVAELLGADRPTFSTQTRRAAEVLARELVDVATFNANLCRLVGDAATAYQQVKAGAYPGEEIALALQG